MQQQVFKFTPITSVEEDCIAAFEGVFRNNNQRGCVWILST